MGFSIGLGPNEGSGNQLRWSHGSRDHNKRHFGCLFFGKCRLCWKNMLIAPLKYSCFNLFFGSACKVSRKGRWSLPRMFFVAFVQFVSKLFFPNLYWDFNGWACNPVPGPQDAQRRVAIIVTTDTRELPLEKGQTFIKQAIPSKNIPTCWSTDIS